MSPPLRAKRVPHTRARVRASVNPPVHDYDADRLLDDVHDYGAELDGVLAEIAAQALPPPARHRPRPGAQVVARHSTVQRARGREADGSQTGQAATEIETSRGGLGADVDKFVACYGVPNLLELIFSKLAAFPDALPAVRDAIVGLNQEVDP